MSFLDSPAAAPVAEARIASLGRRAAGYAIDLLVMVGLQIVFTSLFHWHPIPAGALSFFGYMIIAQVLTHNTIGKYILGIQVVNDNAAAGTPSPRRIFLRETVGRALFLRGYAMASRDPWRRAWSDQVANTVVVMRGTNPWLKGGLATGVALFCLVTFGFAGVNRAETERRSAELVRQIRVEAPAVGALSSKIEKLREPVKTVAELQANGRQILPLLDQYDQSLRQVQAKMLDLQKLGAPGPAAYVQATLDGYETLLKRSAVERQQEVLILSYETGTPFKTIGTDLAPLDAQIVKLNKQFAAQLARSRAPAGQR